MWACKAHIHGGPGGIAIFVGQVQTAEQTQRYTAYQKYEVAGAETDSVEMYMWFTQQYAPERYIHHGDFGFCERIAEYSRIWRRPVDRADVLWYGHWPEPEPGGIERRLDLDALMGGEDLQCGMYAADLRCEHEGGDVTPRSQYHPSLAQHEPPRGGYSPEPVASGAERCLDFHGPSGGELPHWGTYAVDLQCEDEGGDVTPRSQYQPSLAQHESPRGVDEFVVSPSVSARVEAQGCDTSDEEPPDGLGGQYTWDWLDDAEAFVVGGDLQ